MDRDLAAIQAIIDGVIREERERCAMIAEQMFRNQPDCPPDLQAFSVDQQVAAGKIMKKIRESQ